MAIASEIAQKTAPMETRMEVATRMATAPMGINQAARMDQDLIGTGTEAARSNRTALSS